MVNAIRAFKIPCPRGEGVNFLFGRFEGAVPAGHHCKTTANVPPGGTLAVVLPRRSPVVWPCGANTAHTKPTVAEQAEATEKWLDRP